MKDEYDFSHGTRGAIDPLPRGKTRITIRLDDDIIAWFRQHADQSGGGNYQTAINQALRDYIDQHCLGKVFLRPILLYSLPIS